MDKHKNADRHKIYPGFRKFYDKGLLKATLLIINIISFVLVLLFGASGIIYELFMPDPALNTRYFGLTGNVGLGTPGKEFHVEWGTTVTLPYTQFNVYEVARSVYIKIMEW